MKELGITYQHSTPQSMGDQWWFWNCENIPEQLPAFLEVADLKPMECIGYGLSKEEAEKIRDYKSNAKYIELLDKHFKEEQHLEFAHETKMEYLASSIFDFTTYDGEIDILLAGRMIEVLKVILNRNTFEYIKDREQYLNYLTMVNMPFLKDKLDWGGSIRGAWFDNWKEYEIDGIEIEKQELEVFIAQLIEWVS